MIKKLIFCIVFVSISIFYLYGWLFPLFDDQLFKTVSKKCSLQSSCKVYLHEITNFKWDKAYFFPATHSYSNQDIKKITGISFDLQKYKTVDGQEYKTLAMFTHHGKLVKYNFFAAPYVTDNDHLEDTKDRYFTILFSIKTNLYPFRDGDGFENFIKFNKNFQIDYYEITPKNDLLYINFFYRKKYYYNNYITTALVIYSNLNQVHLHNP